MADRCLKFLTRYGNLCALTFSGPWHASYGDGFKQISLVDRTVRDFAAARPRTIAAGHDAGARQHTRSDRNYIVFRHRWSQCLARSGYRPLAISFVLLLSSRPSRYPAAHRADPSSRPLADPARLRQFCQRADFVVAAYRPEDPR